ncbi:MAG: hypothetical protein K2G83_02215 [Ruminococcus sp.]|nr:hypothetical protein [Ruminococcus sp.]
MENIQITSEGIQKNLRKVKLYDAIYEYIWKLACSEMTIEQIQKNRKGVISIEWY